MGPTRGWYSALGNRYLWQGREYSWSTGLYSFRARWYDPLTGRWLSPDPIGISGGLNLYVFCGNSPVNFRDPWGLCEERSLWREFFDIFEGGFSVGAQLGLTGRIGGAELGFLLDATSQGYSLSGSKGQEVTAQNFIVHGKVGALGASLGVRREREGYPRRELVHPLTGHTLRPGESTFEYLSGTSWENASGLGASAFSIGAADTDVKIGLDAAALFRVQLEVNLSEAAEFIGIVGGRISSGW